MNNPFINPFEEQTGFENPSEEPKGRSGKGLAIASMVVGIVAVVSVCCCSTLFFIPLILGLVALGLAIGSRVVAKKFQSMAIAGLILAIVAIVLFAIFFAVELWINSLTPEQLRALMGDDAYEAYIQLMGSYEASTEATPKAK